MKRGSRDTEDARTIGALAHMIRRRRELSLDVVAGFAGISTPYLLMLKRGQRGFNRRDLLEDLTSVDAAHSHLDEPARIAQRVDKRNLGAT